MEQELQQLRTENARLKQENEADNEAIAQFIRETVALGPIPADGDATIDYCTRYMEAVARYFAVRVLSRRS